VFQIGDKIVHPNYGAGIVIEIKERRTLGTGNRYYSIALLGQPETILMVPVGTEEDRGLRPLISESKLRRIWRILRDEPGELPSDHNKRYKLLIDKLHQGDIYQIAEVVRDLAWRKQAKRHLTTRGKRVYEKGLTLLASEVAGVQEEDLEVAEMQISNRLSASIANAAT
jgi:CarD family transcriptional regulator